MPYRLISTDLIEITAAAEENYPAKDYPWTARIWADAVVNVAVGTDTAPVPTATEEDFPVSDFVEAVIAVPAGVEISIYAEANAKVWVSEVKCSA
jgi:hypothetical protein